jgi:hypothetical protein
MTDTGGSDEAGMGEGEKKAWEVVAERAEKGGSVTWPGKKVEKGNGNDTVMDEHNRRLANIAERSRDHTDEKERLDLAHERIDVTAERLAELEDQHDRLKNWTAQLALAKARMDEHDERLMELEKAAGFRNLPPQPDHPPILATEVFEGGKPKGLKSEMAIMMELEGQELESSPAADLAAMSDCYHRQQAAEAINQHALEILTDEIHRQPQDLLDAARIAANQIAEQREELRDWRVLPDLPDRTLVEDNTIDAYRTQLVDAHRRIKELEQQLYVNSKPAPPKG